MQSLGEIKKGKKEEKGNLSSSSSTVGHPLHEVVSPGPRKRQAKVSLGGGTLLRNWHQ